MTNQIVPPYLLESIAAADLPHAAPAARQTLAIGRPQHARAARTQLELSVENGDTLVAVSEPAPTARSQMPAEPGTCPAAPCVAKTTSRSPTPR